MRGSKYTESAIRRFTLEGEVRGLGAGDSQKLRWDENRRLLAPGRRPGP